jgi:SnoaL-like domain
MNGLDKLMAIEQIKKLKARYFRFVDAKDWHALEDLFSEDAMIDISADVSGGVMIGGARLAEVARASLEGCVSVHHGHSPEIEIVSYTSASAIWAMEDTLKWPEESPTRIRSFHGYGHYHESYTYIADRWRINAMRLTRLRVEVEERSTSA